ncbi:hypothetical protein [Xanthomonas vasicola]|uniref:hypothetical protein n=1 Tax=Xanthomonas vasicola TaxID=56459 RepID=UPI0001CC089C|nr:hypothetical protein [Xanthomonas vasicola]AZR30566.1 hypothetical protein KWO_008490 [Xanthomonas vasicola pv. musacearum NCPPB 4379]AZR35390.1 hypothetical protein NX08_013885 [Xanthomonas vasicola]KFA04330.1 hypothetical protein KWM_0121195 [Xanthomonas vasicola pv. musacearum NCPPB 2005]KFA08360.1 hypothetical protein KWQ_0114360 [Xanthomonas vasicola pv. musacearum NCPPB 4380]KFA19613.1 hypothetical protein A11G_0107285 [Xanthomonas vasicola pv. musacearum NCPPB 4392]
MKQQRMRSLAGAAALLSVSAPAVAAAAPALDRSGAVRVGRRFIDLAPQATWKHFNAGQIEHCDYVEAGLLPAGVSMMLQDGRVAGFGVSNAATVGPFGSSVGDTEAAARARLPAGYRVAPHHDGSCGGNDLYLTWRDPHSGFAVRYETGEGSVRSMYWGTWDGVQLVEGCA